MPEFIVEFPKNKEETIENIVQYTKMMDACEATSHCVGIYAETLEEAKQKLIKLKENDYKRSTN